MKNKKSKYIYLDHAATTPLDPLVFKAMRPYLVDLFGNPNSPHKKGRETLKAIDLARETVAKFLNCSSSEIIFTSGATESNNLALRGIIKSAKKAINYPEIITSPIEHPSILRTAQDLRKEGVKIVYLPVDQEGLVQINSLPKLITPSTVLVSIIYANNEIGTIEPIREIGKIIERINHVQLEKKERSWPVIFHTDAVQAVPFLNCNVEYLHVDLLSLSGHKINGPKGVGVLFKRQEAPLLKVQTGGDQEYDLRAGTQDVPSIVGLGKAIETCQKSQTQYFKKMSLLQKWLINEIIKVVPSVSITGPRNKSRLPNNIHLRVKGIPGEELMLLFDQEANIAVSTGSACTAGAAQTSSVLLTLGLKEQEAREGLRVTLGKTTSKTDLKKFIYFFEQLVRRLKK